MIKSLVVLFNIILLVSGSKRDSLSDLDKVEIKKSDSLKHPCSDQLSQSVLSNEKLQNEEAIRQQFTNKEEKKPNIPIVLDCLIKIHEENATEILPETKRVNVSSRRSPGIQYLIETKDNFRDFTTKKNRSKVNEVHTIHIDISEKCTKLKPKPMEKIISSGRRFNNIYDTKHSSVSVNSSSPQRDSNQITKIGLNSTNDQHNISKEGDEDLNTQKITYSTSSILGEPDQIFSYKVTKNPTQKYVLSTTPHDKKIPKDMLLYLDLDNNELTNKSYTKELGILSALNKSKITNPRDQNSKEVSDKTSTEKYNSSSSPTDGINKDSFVLLDFSNKNISDKPFVIKYDLKTILKNKILEKYLQNHDYLKFNEELSTKKYEKNFTPNNDIYNNLLLHHNLGNEAASDKPPEKYDLSSLKNDIYITMTGDQDTSFLNFNDKPSTKRYKQTSTPNNNIHKDLLMYHDLGKKIAGDKNMKLFEAYHRDHTDKEDADKKITNQHPLSTIQSKLSDATFNDLFLYYSLGNKALRDKNSNISKENYHNLMHKLDGNELSSNEYEQTSTPNDDFFKELLLYRDFGNKALSDRHIKISNEHNQNLKHRIEAEILSINKYDQSSTPSDDTLLLYRSLGNKEAGDKNPNPQDLSPKENKGFFLYQNMGNKALSEKNLQLANQEPTHGGKLSFNKYDQNSTPNSDIQKDLLLYHDLKSKAGSDKSTEKYDVKSRPAIFTEHNENLTYKEIGDKFDSSSLPKDDIRKDSLILHGFGDTKLRVQDFDELKSILKKHFQEHHKDISYTKDGGKLLNKKHGQSNSININSNLFPYQGVTSKKANDKYSNNNDDLKKFTMNNKVLKQQDLELTHKDISDSYAIKGLDSNDTSKYELGTTVDITEPHLVEPTTRYSIKDLFKSRVMLLESTRVCYACSSISDHSCVQPGRSTTVKYCRKGHNACLTKTFKTEESEFIVIRDCGTTCDGTWPILDKYKSCSICNEDMCNDHLVDINNAGHIKRSFNLMCFVSITLIIKFIL